MAADYKNILIIKPSALGDIAISLPILASVRASFPNAKITWMVRPEFAPLLEGNPNLDSVLLFDRKTLGNWWRSPKAFGSLFSFLKSLRTSKFDLVLDLQGLFRTALFAFLTGCSRRLGLSTAREFATLFYTDKVSPGDAIHVRDSYLRMLKAAGGEKIVGDYGLAALPDAVSKVSSLLDEKGVTRDYAVFIPGAAHENKCWPADKFAALADRIESEFGLSIIATGVASEKSIADAINEKASGNVMNLAGCTNIQELVAVLSKAKIVISNDTGPGHIAVALQDPIVMIFGPTNPARIEPYGCENAVAVIDADKRGRAIGSDDPAYKVEKVPVDLVFEKVTAQLNQS